MTFFPGLEWGSRALPVILQVEAAECGLACLAMVSTFHGHRIDLATLRSRFAVSLRGMNLQQLVEIADGQDFASRALRLEVEELGELTLPCVLHWDLNHFVVLHSTDANGITIHDPAIGRRFISLKCWRRRRNEPVCGCVPMSA